MSVAEDSVAVVRELGRDILAEELDLVAEVSSLSGWLGGLSGLLVIGSDGINGVSWLNSDNVEAGSEGVGAVVWGVEEIVEGGGSKVVVLGIDLSEDDWGHAGSGLEGSSLVGVVVLDLGESGGASGGRDEGHDVRVVLEDEHSLVGGLIVGGRSDSNDGSGSDVGELELKGESVEGLSGVVSKLELVGVLIELEDLADLGADIEVSALLGGLVKINALPAVVVGEELVGPLSEGTEDGGILSLDGGSLSREGIWGIS